MNADAVLHLARKRSLSGKRIIMRKLDYLPAILSVCAISGFTFAQDVRPEPTVSAVRVVGNIYMIEGSADP